MSSRLSFKLAYDFIAGIEPDTIHYIDKDDMPMILWALNRLNGARLKPHRAKRIMLIAQLISEPNASPLAA